MASLMDGGIAVQGTELYIKGDVEWVYVDCGGVVGFALEPVKKFCNQ